MKSMISAVVLVALATSSALAAPVSLQERATIRYVSPYSSILQKWITTANVTQASIDYAKSLLALDSQIESFYKGDGKTQPTTAYTGYVTVSKTGVAEILAASGSAAAATADVTLQRSWAQISTAAYCETSAISAWSCATCASNAYGRPASIVTADLSNSRFYAGYLSSTNTIFVAFRGSSNSANWATNLDFATTTYWISGVAPSAARFHSGFQSLYSTISSTVRTFVTNLATAYPTASVVFTGHSLGGALAMHAALDLVNSRYVSRFTAANIRVFTQGEPRIGNSAAGVWVTGLGWAGVYRAVNYDDVVPHLPYQWLGFRHHRREWWILADGTSVVTCDDITAADNEDTNCLNSVSSTSSASHGVYFSVAMGSGC